MRSTPQSNTLFYGDNLIILREHIADESVDLIYLDPPFNSNANYNVLFKAPDGLQSAAQIEAFEDTWHWNDSAERAFDAVVRSSNSDAATMLIAMRSFLKENDMMAYLAMMAVRLLELHRVLKPTGSLYLHCDPTASHYLKILLDAVFGHKRFGGEIIWKRTSAHSDAGQGRKLLGYQHDVIFQYMKSDMHTWNNVYHQYSIDYSNNTYKFIEEGTGRLYGSFDITAPGGSDPKKRNPYYEFLGVKRYWRFSKERMTQMYESGQIIQKKPGTVPRQKRYLDEMPGVPLQTLWTDIYPISSQAQERLGYPTQKPLALLERILSASSNKGDVVLDPFCGCGTTVHAAQKLGRRWIGIDVTHIAIGLVRRRLIDAFPQALFEVVGVPKDSGGARELAKADKYQFQFWALSMVEAQPFKGGRKGADGGVDGYIYFKPDGRTTEKAVVSVKGGGNIGVGAIRELIATIERERAKVGILLTLEDPTTTMRKEAAAAGLYDSGQQVGGTGETRKHPRIQILTIEELFEGARPDLPWIDGSVFKKARREKDQHQSDLGL